MNDQALCSLVENKLNGVFQNLNLTSDLELEKDNITKFKLHTIKRLLNTHQKFKNKTIGINDFLLALRDYLLVFNTDIKIDNIIIPDDNPFAIKKDIQSGRYFASYHPPEGININFLKQAYMQNIKKAELNSGNLCTDPLIYNLTGYCKFKSMYQKLAVYGALNTPPGYSTLVSLQTGGGKSLITQMISYQQEGLTIIVVPTVSLAIDQVRVCKNIIKSNRVEEEIFYYSSGINEKPILSAIRNKTAKMLFISPESLLNNYNFKNVIDEANKNMYLKNIVIDEAHIVVDWGASFRVDYQCLEPWRRSLMSINKSIRTILLSATFEKHCIELLKDFFSEGKNWIEIRCDSLRHEPRYIMLNEKYYEKKNKKIIELAQRMPHPMIIYTVNPDDAENIKKLLNKNGLMNVHTFTGLTPNNQRKKLIDEWVDDQFEIMVATSAFGVGVDKSDVRTVLHAYIPQNPNSYYQELGRGGRDRLPCLSLMCTYSEDINISFQRISKKVMTSDKIVGRWESMYNSRNSVRKNNHIYLDTSVKPNYSIKDILDDSPTSDADMNWNIYVILFLRRHHLIKIIDVSQIQGKYTFIIEILDDKLRNSGNILFNLIDDKRTKEWNYYNEAFKEIRSAVNHAVKRDARDCWSEMFYETYDKVSEYCAGCMHHNEPNEGDLYDFPLKASVKEPVRHLDPDQISLFSGNQEILLIVSKEQINRAIEFLISKRLSVIVSDENSYKIDLDQINKKRNVLVIGKNELKELSQKNNDYYLSGIVAVIYSGTDKEIYNQYKLVNKYLSKRHSSYLVHIAEKNSYFEAIDKNMADIINGQSTTMDNLC